MKWRSVVDSVFVVLAVFVFPFVFECWFLQIGLDLHVGVQHLALWWPLSSVVER